MRYPLRPLQGGRASSFKTYEGAAAGDGVHAKLHLDLASVGFGVAEKPPAGQLRHVRLHHLLGGPVGRPKLEDLEGGDGVAEPDPVQVAGCSGFDESLRLTRK